MEFLNAGTIVMAVVVLLMLGCMVKFFTGDIGTNKTFYLLTFICLGNSEMRHSNRPGTGKLGWTKNAPALSIQDQTYEKTLLGKTNFEKDLP